MYIIFSVQEVPVLLKSFKWRFSIECFYIRLLWFEN